MAPKEKSLGSSAFPAKEHDHSACVEEAMARAEDICAAKGLRLTPLRRQVLELVWSSHRPIGAYAILERLNQGAAAPPTVYRSLDFLVSSGLVHRIDSLNAFIGCDRPHHDHAAYFLICEGCGEVAEMISDEVSQAIKNAASKAEFSTRSEVLEVKGLCKLCQPAQAQGNGDR